jgi:hypothetical protein
MSVRSHSHSTLIGAHPIESAIACVESKKGAGNDGCGVAAVLPCRSVMEGNIKLMSRGHAKGWLT